MSRQSQQRAWAEMMWAPAARFTHFTLDRIVCFHRLRTTLRPSMTDSFIGPIRRQARGMRRVAVGRKLGAWQIWPLILVDLSTSIPSNLPMIMYSVKRLQNAIFLNLN